jgi:predicted metal-binding membrane protein
VRRAPFTCSRAAARGSSRTRRSRPALLLVAGAFQFSAMKYRCLDKCRSPLSFVTSRWRGSRERWHSFTLGVEHGAFCVGCCWALMLLMFVTGTASLLWMVALGGVMAVEKNAPWGRRLSTPLGVVPC